MDALLDIHYRILIRRYGSMRALEIMENILPDSYKHEIELDKIFIFGKNGILLYHCRNKWSKDSQSIYLKNRYMETHNEIYLKILNNSIDNRKSIGGNNLPINEADEAEYLSLLK